MRLNNNISSSNNKKVEYLGLGCIAALILIIIGFFESTALLIAGAILLVIIVFIGLMKSNWMSYIS